MITSNQVFNHENHMRDFTYIDNSVEGVIRVLDRFSKSNSDWSGDQLDSGGSRVLWPEYNIGINRPADLLHYIEALEEWLGRKAQVEILPLQQGDVPNTYANVDDLVNGFAITPTASIKDGVARCVDFDREFYGVNANEDR